MKEMNLDMYPYLKEAYTKSQNLAAARVMDVVMKNYTISESCKDELLNAIHETKKDDLQLLAPIQLSMMTENEEKYLSTILSKVVNEINERVLVDDPTKSANGYYDKGRFYLEFVLDDDYRKMIRPWKESTKIKRVRANKGNPKFAYDRINSIGRNVIGRGYIESSEVKRLAELISDNMLYEWAPQYTKIDIITEPVYVGSISYRIDPLTEKTAVEMMSGKTTVEDICENDHTIHMKISESVFNNLESSKGLIKFMERAVRLYAEDIPSYGDEFTRTLVTSPMDYKLAFSSEEMLGHLESTLLHLFSYQDFDINDPSTLQITTEDVYALSSIYTGPPEAENFDELKKQKTKIIEAFKEDSKMMYITPKRTKQIIESLDNVYSEKSAVIARDKMNEWLNVNSKTVQPMTEAWGKRKKKLKKIPMSTIAYVQVEGENIRDANDKYMIAAYCLGKIELVEWYIELLQSGSEKYEVPHDIRYLERMRTELLAAYKTIMSRPIPKADIPIIDIKYPEEIGSMGR